MKNNELPVILGLLSKVEGILSKYRYFYPLINKENLLLWLNQLKQGKLPTFYQSEPIPLEPLHENIPVVVGRSFYDLVLFEQKDVLLVVYNPWEGESKTVIIIIII